MPQCCDWRRHSENRHSGAIVIGNKTYGGDTHSVDFAHNDSDLTKRFVNKETHEGKHFDWRRPDRYNCSPG